MKRVIAILVLSLVSFHGYARDTHASIDPFAPAGTVALSNVQATVAFSPRGQGEALAVHAIEKATRKILVQAYGFSNKAILKALVDAEDRGVAVQVILDKSNDRSRYSGADYMTDNGIQVWIDYQVSIAHNKVMIIDGKDVLTGSFNFTESAQRSNAENILLLENAAPLADIYTTDWNWRLSKSRKFGGESQDRHKRSP